MWAIKLTVIKPNTFYKIKPGGAVEFYVDLGPHIQHVNETLREEGISFPVGLVHSVACYESNRWNVKDKGVQSRSFKDIRSINDAKVYVSRQ